MTDTPEERLRAVGSHRHPDNPHWGAARTFSLVEAEAACAGCRVDEAAKERARMREALNTLAWQQTTKAAQDAVLAARDLIERGSGVPEDEGDTA